MRVLVACEYSGIVRNAFAKLGHDAWSCDILPTESEGNHIQDDVLKHLDYSIVFTKAGNIAIGNSIIIQRKGGNGVHVHGIKDKGDPTHPGNNIQFKLKVNEFVKEMEKYKLGQYIL